MTLATNERTLVLAKPDAMQRGLGSEVLRRMEQRGLKLAGLKLMRMSEELARTHYAEHEGKPFYAGLVEYITSAPVVAAVFEGPRAISIVCATIGSTDPAEASPGSLRADYGLDKGRNLVHASDSPESAAREIDLFFRPDELVDWKRDTDGWIME
jgi:nucleoside-diphosphate kinase